ncbi:glycosyl hydrolase [Microbacterium betulae]|uniref:Glycosyl hydrolase n=1 Tax=Microbacterium betulae TaxID=2981139 RepID=A0AA97FIP1_9MICO|nr:glycosyl hydrolase [Microbacterium sp. AB]WOF23755.1 glycosyl hydrolase [Microbacterium sp. AB]
MSRLHDHLPHLQEPPIEFRPELRWWLAEGLHTDQTLRREIDAAHRLGFGGMEFLAMDEEAIDHARYGWGSEEWVHDSEIVVEETTARQMSVSFTSGTNWSNANLPTIDPDHPAASQELDFVFEDVRRGAGRDGALPRIDLAAERTALVVPGERVAPTKQTLVAVIAVPLVAATDGGGSLDASAVVDLTASVQDLALTWEPEDDRTWRLFVFWSHGTGQTASPSASVNYTVNYLERAGVDAVIDYWDSTVLTSRLRERIARNPRAQMYMDSLELSTWGDGGMFWGASVREEFRSRRGYDIVPWLPFLVREVMMMAASTTYRYDAGEAERATVEKVRHDYVRTLTDLYIENMLRPFAGFLHENGVALRAEISYGLPFELTRPGPEVDGIETESLEFGSQIDAYRLLGGPAHLFGKQYSSETGATTRNHMLDHRFYDQIIATQLAAGVTKTVLHGWASVAGAEGATQWPGHEGMWPMFSERFDTRQPASEFYPLWNRTIGRFQYLLRQGRPRIDVGILRTDHFVDNMSGMTLVDAEGRRIPDEDAYGRLWMRDRENHWWQDLGMQDAGWSYEFLDPSLLLHEDVVLADGVVQPGGPGYQALIVYQEALDADAAALLLDWARRGLRVVIVNGARELRHLLTGRHTTHRAAASRTPGLDGRDDELASIVDALRELPTVAEVHDPAETLPALRALGVVGRAEFTADEPSVLTYLREDGDLLHLYAYHFLYETGSETTVEIALPGHGDAHRIDPTTGTVARHRGVRIDGDRTVVSLTLAPGETALVTLDRSAAARESAPDELVPLLTLEQWDIVVESWDAGEPELIVEDRGLGYETREVRPTTAITRLPAAETTLRPWTRLAGVGPDVSGVGEYRTTFRLDADAVARGRLVLDLGSTSGGLGAISLNGSEPRGFDTSHPVVDIAGLAREGENELVVRVASSLNNRLLARGYYDSIPDVVLSFVGRQDQHVTRVREHGLVGPVRVLRAQA